MDLFISIPALIASLPLQACAAFMILLTMGRPIFFRQERPGLDAEPFEMIKFRTMSEASSSKSNPQNISRVTPVGAVLRNTSIDELPTLWNVIKGDMSIVGPRPLLMKYLPRYSAEQRRRHEVKPGLTGLAQTSGRNAISWERRLELDVIYVDHHTLRGDMRIMLATAYKVLRREGINSSQQTTMPEFGVATNDDGKNL